jgi:hypothetical protein
LDPDYKPEASELGFNLNTGMSTMEKDSIYDGTIRVNIASFFAIPSEKQTCRVD